MHRFFAPHFTRYLDCYYYGRFILDSLSQRHKPDPRWLASFTSSAFGIIPASTKSHRASPPVRLFYSGIVIYHGSITGSPHDSSKRSDKGRIQERRVSLAPWNLGLRGKYWWTCMAQSRYIRRQIAAAAVSFRAPRLKRPHPMEANGYGAPPCASRKPGRNSITRKGLHKSITTAKLRFPAESGRISYSPRARAPECCRTLNAGTHSLGTKWAWYVR